MEIRQRNNEPLNKNIFEELDKQLYIFNSSLFFLTKDELDKNLYEELDRILWDGVSDELDELGVEIGDELDELGVEIGIELAEK